MNAYYLITRESIEPEQGKLKLSMVERKKHVAAYYEFYHWYEKSFEVIICHMHKSIHINLEKDNKKENAETLS